MKPVKNNLLAVPAPIVPLGYRLLLWGALFFNSIFLIWNCLDRYLAPRFLFLSALLIPVLLLLFRELRHRGDWRLHTFDALLLGWYGLNLASVTWAFSGSEGIFYAQKTLLLFAVYWLFRQGFLQYESLLDKTISTIIIGLSWTVALIIFVQIALALEANGLDNETLYAYATGVFGNKGLASDFLFFLVVLNIFILKKAPKKSIILFNLAILTLLILLLQTRTVYLALATSVLLYTLTAGLVDRTIRPVFVRWVLPAFAIGILGIAAFLTLKKDGGSLSERLNPLTYLESASANERRFVWYKTDLLNRDHFWWGVGNGSWKIWLPSKSIAGAYRLEEKGIVFTRAHNDYLEIRAEMGIVGAIWFVGIFVAAAWGLGRAFFSNTHTKHEVSTIAAGLLGYCVVQYFDFPRERIEMQVMLGLLLALMAHFSRDFWKKTPAINISKIAPFFLTALLAGLLFNVAIGYYRVDGEIHNVLLLKAFQKQDNKKVLKEAKASHNSFYEYNDVVIPFEWYEGIAHYKMNQMEEAVAAFGAARQHNPWSFQILNNYATALASQQKFPEAIDNFEQALAINPKYDDGKFNLSYCYLQTGNVHKALEWVEKVDTIPNPKSEDERQKNKEVLLKKASFLAGIKAPTPQ